MTTLENEIKPDRILFRSIAWGLFWRWFLVGAIPGMALANLIQQYPWFGFLLQLTMSFLGLWVAVAWLFDSGRIGSIKIMFMESAHFQQLPSNPTVERDAK